METWSLEHPEVGLIEVEFGFDAEFHESYPDWPEKVPTYKDGVPDEFIYPPLAAPLKDRVLARFSNPAWRVQIKIDDEVVGRYTQVKTGRYPLKKQAESKLVSAENVSISREYPYLQLLVGQLKDVLEVHYRKGSEVVEFDPPSGSRGKQRQEAMKDSIVKRFAFPLVSGLGKAGWALSVLLLGPLVSRLLGWLFGFLPDWELPQWIFPQIELPQPKTPQIVLPDFPWPDWHLPQVEIPGWVEFMLDYTKIWVPLVIGLFFAVNAVRNHRKSEREKQRWENAQEEQSSPAEQR